ncbi:SRPBCC family protein [Bordetella sp. 2513F-2]
MNPRTPADAYGALIEPATLKIQRVLPGSIERVWAYLTESELRRKWLAAGEMRLQAGAPVELVWRNDELSDPPGQRPAGFSEEQRMQSRVLEVDPPRSLAIAWDDGSEVRFSLEARDQEVLLTVVHRRLPDRPTLLGVSAGWHIHLDVLAARLAGRPAPVFWDGWLRLKQEYDLRLPA